MPFQPGNKLAAGIKSGGRPPKADEEKVKSILNKACPDEDKIAIIRAQVEKAKDGDTPAFLALRDHLFGKPKQQLDVAGMGENGGIEIIVRHVATGDRGAGTSPGTETD